jgi:hypothetical protein
MLPPEIGLLLLDLISSLACPPCAILRRVIAVISSLSGP